MTTAGSETSSPPPRQPTVALALLVTLLFGTGSLGLLFYRAATVPPNDHRIVVRGTEAWNGLDLSVAGGDLKEPQVTKFEELGQYIVPFYLSAGKYDLTIKNGDTIVYQKQIDLSTKTIEDIDLAREGATTQPATQPTTQSATQPTTEPASASQPSTIPA